MKKAPLLLVLLFFLYGCGGDKKEPAEPVILESATLLFPLENSLCNVGTSVTATDCTISFEWEADENAESYELVIKNLSTGVISTYTTIETSDSTTLLRATPYSWYVVSVSGTLSQSTTSEVWKFYVAGDAVVSYAPFPAEIVSPAMASVITTSASVITLDWTGSDIDGDITGYDVYFGTAENPPVYKTDLTESILSNVPIAANTIYFWKIITTDSKGNKSDSGTSQFKIAN